MTAPSRIASDRHPCFNRHSSGSCGRVHLPVAPKCNLKCNYCNRKYDCVNESRPGVTSAVLKPHQALEYMHKVLEAEPRITVAGIAGPGDPMANPEQTLETMRLLKEHYPHMLFCLSSNGLAMPAYLDDLASLGVTHATVTMNAVDPKIAAKIYAWAMDGKVVYRGHAAAELLLSRQLEAVAGLKTRGIAVKINSIVIPGINEHHVVAVAKAAEHLGADLQNLIPMHPNEGTPFGHLTETPGAVIKSLRSQAGTHIEQMTHCRRCRADAVGLLDKDLSGACAGLLTTCAKLAPAMNTRRPHVAVATREGMLVNQHLGEAATLQIWTDSGGSYELVEERAAPSAGCGPGRWEALADLLSDCNTLLAAALGDTPRKILSARGIKPVEAGGFIQHALETVYTGGDTDTLKTPRRKAAASGCSGGGGGCG
ncbi:MAG: radical SAM protein [Desulfovibrionaceae bacterium]